VIFITYEPRTSFDPYSIRDACAEEDIAVEKFQVVAKGQILTEGSEHYFIAGEDRFQLIALPEEQAEGTLEVVGTVDDREKPYKMKIVESKPVEL
jgi:hypothetical protein